MASNIFAGFPELVIAPGDVYGSWKKWSAEFKLALNLKRLELGTEVYEEEVHDASTSQTKVTKTRRERFCEKSQLWTLLRCVGEESREALSTLGVDLSDENLTYNTVWDKLKEHYERDESEYVKVDKFVSCRQTAGEEDRDYLLRCERLGRRCDFTAMNVRERFTLSIAVRGLRDVMLKRELMANDRLDWPTLNRILRARTGAQESLNALGDRVETPRSSDVSSRVSSAGGKSAPTESTSVKPVVKQEVSEVRYGSHREYSGDRRSRHSRDSSRDRDWRREGSRDRYGSRDYSRGRYERREYSRERGSRGDRDEGRYDNYRSRQSRRDDSRDRSYRSGRNDSRERVNYSRRDSSYDRRSGRDDSRGRYERNNRSYRDVSRESKRSEYGSESPRSLRGPEYSPRRPGDGHKRSDSPSSQNSDAVCFDCNRRGHISRFCPDGKCYNCQRIGHHQRDCRNEKRCRHCLKVGVSAANCPSCSGKSSPGYRYRHSSVSPKRVAWTDSRPAS